MSDVIVNKVDESGLIQFDLSELVPKGDRIVIDLKDFLYEGIMLREKDFRDQVKTTDWSVYQDKFVGITNSADAIVPLWAYMLLTSALQPFAALIIRGNKAHLEGALLRKPIENLDVNQFQDARVIVKGCGDKCIPESSYIAITEKLQPVVKSLMFGEACSAVPVFKRR